MRDTIVPAAVLLLAAVALAAVWAAAPAAEPPADAAAGAPTPPADDGPLAAPDFTLTALEGESVTLSDLRGGWVVVNFWATWCLPCAEEMPALQALADDHAGDLTVLGVNVREERAAVQGFVDAHEIRFPVLVDPDPATLSAYQVVALPQTVIVDPGGEIAYRQFGPVTVGEIEAVLRGTTME